MKKIVYIVLGLLILFPSVNNADDTKEDGYGFSVASWTDSEYLNRKIAGSLTTGAIYNPYAYSGGPIYGTPNHFDAKRIFYVAPDGFSVIGEQVPDETNFVPSLGDLIVTHRLWVSDEIEGPYIVKLEESIKKTEEQYRDLQKRVKTLEEENQTLRTEVKSVLTELKSRTLKK